MKNKVTIHGWTFIATLIISIIGVAYLSTLQLNHHYDDIEYPQVQESVQDTMIYLPRQSQSHAMELPPDDSMEVPEERESSPPEVVDLEPIAKIEAYTGLIHALKDFGVAWSPILAPVIIWFTQRNKKYLKDSEDNG